MKSISMIGLLVVGFTALPGHSAQLRVDSFGLGQDVGSEVFGIFLDGEELNGQFDTIIVEISTNPGSLFLEPLNSRAIDFFIPPGPGFCCLTFISFQLSSPPSFGGNGFTVLGAVEAENQVAFSGGPLGQTIDTQHGPNVGDDGLFLANIILADGTATATAQLVRAGDVIEELNTAFGVPEPPSVALLGLTLVTCSFSGSRTPRRRTR